MRSRSRRPKARNPADLDWRGGLPGSQYRDRAGLVSFVYATVTSLPSTSDGWFGTYISDGKNTNQVTLTGHTFKAFSFGAGDETLSLTNAGEIFAAMGDGASSVRLAGDTAATLTTGMKSSFTLTLEQTAGFTGYLQGTGSVNISGIGSDNNSWSAAAAWYRSRPIRDRLSTSNWRTPRATGHWAAAST